LGRPLHHPDGLRMVERPGMALDNYVRDAELRQRQRCREAARARADDQYRRVRVGAHRSVGHLPVLHLRFLGGVQPMGTLRGAITRASALKIAGAGLTIWALAISVLAITTIDAFSDGRYAISVL